MMTYRSMRPDDVAAALSLCRSAHWNQLARDWEILLKLSPEGCRVAEQEKIVGTVTTVRYQNHFSWIGMVLVDPASQRQGIGIRLLQEALQILQHQETVKLDATPEGRQVYLKLNFRDEYSLSRMSLLSMETKLKTSSARSVQKNDLLKLSEFDREIFGADRLHLLAWQLESAPNYAFLVEDSTEVLGYCLGRPGYNFVHIGPVIAKNIDVAKNLVSAALNNCMGQSVILDCSLVERQWMDWLISIGFAVQRSFFRMYRGSNRFPGVPQKQFAILGPEFG